MLEKDATLEERMTPEERVVVMGSATVTLPSRS